MQTISSTALNKIQFNAEEGTPSIGFTTAVAMPLGAPVKLNSDGTVSLIAAHTDRVIGIVTKGTNNVTLDNRVTVQLIKTAVVVGQADGTVAVGALVDCSGVDGTTQLGKYKATATGGNEFGIALTGATTGLPIQVMVL